MSSGASGSTTGSVLAGAAGSKTPSRTELVRVPTRRTSEDEEEIVLLVLPVEDPGGALLADEPHGEAHVEVSVSRIASESNARPGDGEDPALGPPGRGGVPRREPGEERVLERPVRRQRLERRVDDRFRAALDEHRPCERLKIVELEPQLVAPPRDEARSPATTSLST